MEDVSIKKRELHFRRRPKKVEGSADLSEHQRAAILGGGERFFKYVNIRTRQLSFPPVSFRPQVLILETDSTSFLCLLPETSNASTSTQFTYVASHYMHGYAPTCFSYILEIFSCCVIVCDG